MMKRADEPSRTRDFRHTFQLYFALFKHVLTIPFQRKIELRNPQQVLRQKLGDDLEVLDFATGKLVNFGDIYTSTIVKVTVDVKCSEGPTRRLNLVAKMLPSSAFLRKLLQCDVLMAKEIFLYEQIVPAYRKLYGSEFDIAPEFYGGRLTAKPGEAAVDDGAVLLENLKESGHVMAERLKGLTQDHLRTAVPAIAKFHAIGLAMKQRDPEFFSKIQEHAKDFQIPAEFLNIGVSKLMKSIKNNEELSRYYEPVKSLARFDSNGNYLLFDQFDPKDPYACLVHRDLWINNMMFHVNEDRIEGFKFFDFQVYGIASPMQDLLYFLLTSLPRTYDGFDEAVKLYRDCLCEALRELRCDEVSLFEGEAFERRLKEDAKSELLSVLVHG